MWRRHKTLQTCSSIIKNTVFVLKLQSSIVFPKALSTFEAMPGSNVRTRLQYLLDPEEEIFSSDDMSVEVEMTSLPSELQALITAFQVRAPTLRTGRIKVRVSRPSSGERNQYRSRDQRRVIAIERNKLRTERYRNHWGQ